MLDRGEHRRTRGSGTSGWSSWVVTRAFFLRRILINNFTDTIRRQARNLNGWCRMPKADRAMGNEMICKDFLQPQRDKLDTKVCPRCAMLSHRGASDDWNDGMSAKRADWPRSIFLASFASIGPVADLQDLPELPWPEWSVIRRYYNGAMHTRYLIHLRRAAPGLSAGNLSYYSNDALRPFNIAMPSWLPSFPLL